MVFLIPLCLLTISYVIGSLPMKSAAFPRLTGAERCVIGTLFLWILWEGFMLVGIKGLLSFAHLCHIYTGCLLVLFLFSVLSFGRELVKPLILSDTRLVLSLGVFVIMLVLCSAYICIMEPELSGDYTVETVNTTIVSDLVYENNPYMGSTFAYGITPRGKFVTLPLFYAYLTKTTHLHATKIVYEVVPIWMLILSAIIYFEIAKLLFPEKEKAPFHFATGVLVLTIFGAFSKNCIYFYQLRRGFRGESVLASVLLPILLYLLVMILKEGKKQYVSFLVMDFVAAIMIVDVLKGVFVLFFAMVVALFIALGYRIGGRVKLAKND